ncbi:MAG: membrane protein insertase YidC [bacterium]
MDKKTVILIILLAALVIFWMPIMTKLGLIKPAPPRPVTTKQVDTVYAQPETIKRDTIVLPAPLPDTATAKFIAQKTDEPLPPQDSIIIETDLWLITLTNYGGGPVSLKLKNYKYPSRGSGESGLDTGLVEMLPDCRQATPQFLFNGGAYDANSLVYSCSHQKGKYDVSGSSFELLYTFVNQNGGSISKKYRFYPDRYSYDLIIEVNSRSALGFERRYSFEWNNHLAPTEISAMDDYNSTWAMSFMGSDRVKYDDYTDNKYSISNDGVTKWIASRSKYFTAILIPRSREASGAKSTGVKEPLQTAREAVQARRVTVGLMMDIQPGEQIRDSFTVFAGPIDYELLRGLDNSVADIIDIGTTPFVGWIIKIFAIPIMWLLPRMYDFIPNYGFVIIIFSLVVKVLTWPLSKKTVKSMMAMKELQPKMQELQKKHKNNPQALNREMMKLYKEAGVNPFSGCLPYLPQLPLFIALYSVFSATILLRQAPFILWWDDLSRGALSLTDPYIIMVILMMVLMFVQQKMTMTDPKNKILIYLMPLMMGFIFYRASAGLVLYWTCFSLFSFLEQLLAKPKTQTSTDMTVQT